MNVPIWLEQRDGVFIASSVTDPEVRAEGLTRAAALRDIRRRLLDQAGGRELVFVSLDDTPIDDIFGSMAGDPDLQNICDEAYRLRDAERDLHDEQAIDKSNALVGLSALFGKYRDDDILTEICDEAYRQRDAATLPGASHDSV